jgi:hypothetical protein
MDSATINKVLQILKKEIRKWKVPAVGVIAGRAVDRPFETLVSTILSLRTKDKVTGEASHRILECAPTPRALVSLTVPEIERLIYPVGFYRTKAQNLLNIIREKSPAAWMVCWHCRASGGKPPIWFLRWVLGIMVSVWTRTSIGSLISGAMSEPKPRKIPNSPSAKSFPEDTGKHTTIYS